MYFRCFHSKLNDAHVILGFQNNICKLPSLAEVFPIDCNDSAMSFCQQPESKKNFLEQCICHCVDKTPVEFDTELIIAILISTSVHNN